MVLEFKSTTLTIPVLQLTGHHLSDIDQQLKDKVAQAPEFFKSSPLLIDLHKLAGQNPAVKLSELIELTRRHGFMPIGIRGGNDAQNAAAHALNLPVYPLHAQNQAHSDKKPERLAPVRETEQQPVENKLITQPIRSGQRVYAKGDLIVTAPVSAGAEIMAEGNIHVYGCLRGRALAGVLGNTGSRIFCSDLQAELISIAGIYRLSDDLSDTHARKPVQISLDNQTLIIKDI